ncbi:metallophosphoesterase [Dysgonomonas sp. 216]|uniref:metallophosphoesterase family protein n=1 Tax=Dysgonomonas sp. 216 TaxID=2302934 RepID=UPI0013D21BB3|nr:metallophosphoesterase [Dysgonomonas sp. 216]NDW17492.1 metallophosphoesterase [Dysgonomonas sp. 216]
MKHLLLLLLIPVFFQSCEMIEYHPYDGRIKGETGVNAKNIARIEKACEGKTTIRFAMIGDTQRWYDDTEDFVKVLNKRDDIDFVIHGGDIADFGMTKEFIWIRDIMNGLKVPYVALLGNHDCLANGEEIFRKIFGPENFSFLAGDTKFICLNTNALEFDYSHPVPDFQFIESEYSDEREAYKKTVFAMHVRPFDDQFNNNIANVFQRYLKEFRNLQFCLNAHNHRVATDDLFDDGVIYYGVSNIKKRKYLVFTLKPDNLYEYEVVEF